MSYVTTVHPAEENVMLLSIIFVRNSNTPQISHEMPLITKPRRYKRWRNFFVVELLYVRELTQILMFVKWQPNQNPLSEQIYQKYFNIV